MDLNRFVDYCYDFYGPGGIYPMNVNKANILAATAIVMAEGKHNFIGDSIDRERVRDVMIDYMGFRFPTVA